MKLADKILRYLNECASPIHRKAIFQHFYYYERGSIIQVLRALRDTGLIEEQPRQVFSINEHGAARCQ